MQRARFGRAAERRRTRTRARLAEEEVRGVHVEAARAQPVAAVEDEYRDASVALDIARDPAGFVVSLDANKDPATGRLDLIGVIGTMQVPVLPVQLPGRAVLVSLTNLQGGYGLALEVIDLEKDERLAGAEQDQPFRCADPLRVWTEVARVGGPFEIEHPGRYACRLLLNGDYVDEVVFEVVQAGAA